MTTDCQHGGERMKTQHTDTLSYEKTGLYWLQEVLASPLSNNIFSALKAIDISQL